MKLQDKLKAWATIRETARRFGITPEQCRADMQEAIDEAWANSRSDPESKEKWAEYFPAGKKPSVEEFMMVLSEKIKRS